jgi:hypothetical protein
VIPASASQITLMRSDQLSTAQTVLRVLKPLPVILVVLSLALFGAALAVAPGWRRRALRAYGVGFVVAGVGALIARSVGGDQFVSSFARTAAAEPSIATVYSIATELLVNVAVATIAYGVVMIAGAWLAGPNGWATAVRRVAAPYWREWWIAYSALAVIVAILVAWAPTPAWRNGPMLVILIALLAAGVEALRRQVIREFPTATREGAANRRRERWERFTAAGRRSGATLKQTAARTAETASGALASSRIAVASRVTNDEDARIEQLERLAKLRAAGVLDDDELRSEKARILAHDTADDGAVNTGS